MSKQIPTIVINKNYMLKIKQNSWDRKNRNICVLPIYCTDNVKLLIITKDLNAYILEKNRTHEYILILC